VVLQAAPIDAVLVLDLEPRILFALLDMMLGSRSPSPPERRPLTEIETRLAARLIRLCLEAYREAWEHVLTLDLQIERFEHNPQQARTMRGSEQTLIVDFEICAGKERGHLNLCVPTKAIEKMTSRLTAFAERSEP
jgi:flagellar motor switch protein FliM